MSASVMVRGVLVSSSPTSMSSRYVRRTTGPRLRPEPSNGYHRAVNVAVLVKWVPEPQGTPRLGEDHLLVREGADGALDPGDEYGLERALQLVERDGGEVVLVSMGPEIAVAAVQRGLAMGAARGVLVSDDSLRGADTLVTARVLAAAIGSLGQVDMVLAAVESTDGYTGTLPITVAELLGLPSVTFATSLDVEGGELRAERQT